MVLSQFVGRRPPETTELILLGKDYQWEPKISLSTYIRSSEMLLREAAIYYADNEFAHAFMLLSRYTDLVVNALSTHPDARLPKYKYDMKRVYDKLPDVVENMEKLKPIINARAKEWDEEVAAEKEASKSFGTDGLGRRSAFGGPTPRNHQHSHKARTVAPQDHGDIPVKVFRREQKRREEASRSGKPIQRGWNDSDRQLDEYEMQRRMMEDTRRRLNNPQDDYPSRPRKLNGSRSPVRQSSSTRPNVSYNYPAIRQSREATYEERPRSRDARYNGDVAPQRPAKLPMAYDMPPLIPSKVSQEPSREPTPDADDIEYTFEPSAALENGKPLRCLFLPQDLRLSFLRIAAKNTSNNLETCGILCGKLMKNALFIEGLIIPEQKSTSDTCDMENESALYDCCASKDWMVCGWIHTHPTQSCFLSSRDLHTHAGFQVMMPEAIAIVCAPRADPSWGVFRLTDPPGLPSVLNCTNPGIFHPHPEPDIYTGALRPGHVFEQQQLPFQVIDLRPEYQ